MRIFFLTLLVVGLTTQLFAHATYTGRSGAPGRTTCSSSCHGNPGGTVSITGFPASYIPGQTYTLGVAHSGGDPIANFNASCRIVSSNANAGTIAAGTATSVYNVTGETNGVHFTSVDQDAGTFLWTAPPAGSGAVSLYAGAFQGQVFDAGFYSTMVLASNEAAPLPGMASAPTPADLSTAVVVTPTLSWSAGSGAASQDVYFGTANPPAFIANQSGISYVPAPLAEGVTYFWRVDERNAAGVTTGPVWQFTTLISAPVAAPSGLVIAPTSSNVISLAWNSSSGAASYSVYRDVTPVVSLQPVNRIATVTDTLYMDSTALSVPGPGYFYAVTAARP
jgi:hypothetical protein